MRVSALLLLVCPPGQALQLGSALRGAAITSHAPRRHAAPSAKAPEFIYERQGETLRFGAKQTSLNMIRPEAAGSLEEFITSDPKAIALSSWSADQIEQMEDGSFVINAEQFGFLSLQVGVVLNATVWLDEATTTAHFESKGFRVTGLGDITDSVSVTVRGRMRATPPSSSMCALQGQVEFEARGAIPSLVRSAPESALRGAIRSVSETIMRAASERFGEEVPNAYYAWASSKAKRG